MREGERGMYNYVIKRFCFIAMLHFYVISGDPSICCGRFQCCGGGQQQEGAWAELPMGRGRSREHGTLRLCHITEYAHQVRER